MKKKLMTGLGMTLLIFTIGVAVIIKNLDDILIYQKLINEQNMMTGKYNEMLFQMKGAQAELYRHQAGYTRNIDDLVNYIEAFDENMDFISGKYEGRPGGVACLQCHAKIGERITSLNAILSEIRSLIKSYKEDVSMLLTTTDKSQTEFLEDGATKKGNNISGLLEKVIHATNKMQEEIQLKGNMLIKRSLAVIFLSLFLIIASSLVIFIIMIRGITGPVNSLIKGIQTIASGDFTRRVAIYSSDEIGFMAAAFNNMAERLNVMNFEKDGLLSALQGFNEDLEDKILVATEKLRSAQDNMVRAEMLAAVGTLAAGVSHEISTPLNTIIGFAQLTLSEIEAGPAKSDLKVIEQEALRCKKIVQGLLDFARRPAQEGTVPTDVNMILNETLTLIEYQPSMRRIAIKKDMDPILISVEADPLQLKQVFLNVVLNAVQAMPEGGELRIVTTNLPEGRSIEIVISDTGPGISEEDRQKIFQPFFTTKKDGTGLGLSISYGIIKAHGGEIFAGGTPGGGTAIRITLPSRHYAESEDNARFSERDDL